MGDMKGAERDGANMGIGETSWLIGGEHNGLAKRFPLTWLQPLCVMQCAP